MRWGPICYRAENHFWCYKGLWLHSASPKSAGQRMRLCCLLERRRKHPPCFRHGANRLSAKLAVRVHLKPLFCLACCCGIWHGVVSLQGEDGVTPSKTRVFFYPQAVWMFWLLLPCLSKAMKAACWLTTGVAVTVSVTRTPHLLLPLLRRRFVWFPVVFPLRCFLFFLLFRLD